jgi:hypothetical protein
MLQTSIKNLKKDKLVRDAERKEKRDLRLKKINEINEISQKGK